MRVMVLVVAVLISGCPIVDPVSNLSVCSMGHVASRGGKGRLTNASGPLKAGETRSFTLEEAWIGQPGTYDFKVGSAISLRNYSGGAMVLLTTSSLSGVTDFLGDGLFWEVAPGLFANENRSYATYEDGGFGAALTFEELKAEVLRGVAAKSLEACNTLADGGSL